MNNNGSRIAHNNNNGDNINNNNIKDKSFYNKSSQKLII